MPVSKHDAQGYGSAITYGRRYSLLTACGVAPEDDDGNGASKDDIDASRMNDFLVAIAESETVDQLKKIYAEAYAACAGNQAWQAKVIAAKNKRKEGK